MKTSFILNDDSVSIETANDHFDLHNCFDLSGLDVDLVVQQVTLLFTKHGMAPGDKGPERLKLIFSSVDYFDISNGAIGKMVRDVAELGYKQPSDFDHNWLVSEKNRSLEDHLFIRLAGDEFLRIHGKSATLICE